MLRVGSNLLPKRRVPAKTCQCPRHSLHTRTGVLRIRRGCHKNCKRGKLNSSTRARFAEEQTTSTNMESFRVPGHIEQRAGDCTVQLRHSFAVNRVVLSRDSTSVPGER